MSWKVGMALPKIEKLIKLLIISLIIFIIYKSFNLWSNILSKIIQIFTPFLIAIILVYITYPIYKLLIKKINKAFTIFIIILFMVSLVAFILFTLSPLLYKQFYQLFISIMSFIINLKDKYNININGIYSLITSFGSYLSLKALKIVEISLSYIIKIIFTLFIYIYLLSEIDNIKRIINNKNFTLLITINNSMKKYLGSFLKIIIICFFEYFICYLLIGHPDFLLLSSLTAIFNLIPYLGSFLVSVLAVTSAALISKTLLIKTVVTVIVLGIVDGYIVEPLVYGKDSKIHPLLALSILFIGVTLFGSTGAFVSIPLLIIIMDIYNVYKKEITSYLKGYIKVK